MLKRKLDTHTHDKRKRHCFETVRVLIDFIHMKGVAIRLTMVYCVVGCKISSAICTSSFLHLLVFVHTTFSYIMLFSLKIGSKAKTIFAVIMFLHAAEASKDCEQNSRVI